MSDMEALQAEMKARPYYGLAFVRRVNDQDEVVSFCSFSSESTLHILRDSIRFAQDSLAAKQRKLAHWEATLGTTDAALYLTAQYRSILDRDKARLDRLVDEVKPVLEGYLVSERLLLATDYLHKDSEQAEGTPVVHAPLDTTEPGADGDHDWVVTCSACSQEQRIKGDLPAECPQCGANMMSLRERRRAQQLSGMMERGELMEWFCQPTLERDE